MKASLYSYLTIVSRYTMGDLAARLEPLLLLARNARGAAAAKVIDNATSSVCRLYRREIDT